MKLEAMRQYLFCALGVSGLSAITGCNDRVISDSETDTSTTGNTTASAGTEAPIESTGVLSAGPETDGDTGALECVANTMNGEGMICLPRAGDSCEPCGDGCQNSNAAAELAEEVFGGGCCFWNVTPVCGPVELDEACCYVLRLDGCGCDGRPLSVAGAPRVALVDAREGWCDTAEPSAPRRDAERRALASYWTRAALDEHASIASFARFTLQLLRLGAPPLLVAATRRAMHDEIRHARACFGLASAYAGVPRAPGALSLDDVLVGPQHPHALLEAIVRATIEEGCVGETLAAARAAAASVDARDPAVRAPLERIAEDELRHAALAWRVLAWVARADLGGVGRAVVRHAIEELRVTITRDRADDEAAARPGLLSPRARAAVQDAALHQLIRPCCDALLASLHDASRVAD